VIIFTGRGNISELKERGKEMKHVMKVVGAGLFLCIILTGCEKRSPNDEQTRARATKVILKALHAAVNQFKMDTGRYPTKDEGLTVLIERPSDVESWDEGGYLVVTEMPKDSWNNDFIYELNPESGRPFVIKSLGADGKEGDEDYNDDILSTD
jgi:general secretion pathway protein G